MAERIHGPYPHRARWRVVGVRSDGSRVRETFATREAADAFLAEARSARTRTIGEAVSAFLDWMAEAGRRPSTVTTARYRLVAFLRLGEGDRPLSNLDGEDLYDRRREDGVRPDTHRGELALASTWATWCVKRGWLPANPFAEVEPMGARSHGRPQLRIDEARAFLAAALADASPAGLACALALLSGARASEVVCRLARDLDDSGRVLWVTESKTRAGVRQIPVPAVLQAGLLALARGRAPSDPLWGDVTRHWLSHHVRRLCGVAGVPEVSPHGLRGTVASIRVGGGEAVEAVARALGQAGPAVTRRHYLAPGVEAGALADAAVSLLVGNKNLS